MCGISAIISIAGYRRPDQTLKDLLRERGPDHIGYAETQIERKDGSCYSITLTSTVLALRGGLVTAQPFVHAWTQSLFGWNGEAWKIESQPVVGNDGQLIFDLLVKSTSAQVTASEAVSATLGILRSISGPFAFFFLDKVHSQIYFGRDRLGRRSLLYRMGESTLDLASVADTADTGWCEVEADGIYHVSLTGEMPPKVPQHPERRMGLSSVFSMKTYSWDAEDCVSPSLGIFNKAKPKVPHTLNVHSSSVKVLQEQLTESLRPRVLNIPVPPGLQQENNVRVAILFSGGLDCTVLARMVHDILPGEQEVDLINVAFENPRVVQAAINTRNTTAGPKKRRQMAVDDASKSQEETLPADRQPESSPYEDCPDRATGRKAFQELKTVCPGRVWRFVAVNVPYTETIANRATVVSLIHPHNTEMDLSIAYALYFAARGVGVSSDYPDDSPVLYTTPARVLLSGLGADELFGGYTRHSTAFNRNEFDGLLDELELDVNRLGKRNLGRDDRVISHWGKEARFPYLDESLVKWAVECPIWEKCGFQSKAPSGPDTLDIEPGKKVLRLLAHSLGMTSVAQEKKRAIQFGARTAKMEAGRTKGTQLIT